MDKGNRLTMLNFQDFFAACVGQWTTERTYHSTLTGEVERSYTQFQATALEPIDKEKMLSTSAAGTGAFEGIKIDTSAGMSDPIACPGFAVSFATRSEKGEEVSMSLKALFVPDRYIVLSDSSFQLPPLPVAAQVPSTPEGEVIQGFYLRDEGYSEAGAIAGRFTYQPTRQTLEMITYYRRSVAVDQMRFVAPNTRLRTILTYQRPAPDAIPTVIDLVGFGVEQKAA